MTSKRLVLLTSTLIGLVLGAFVLTVAMLAPVQAQPDDAYITIVKGPDQVIVRGTRANFNIMVTSTYTGTLTDVEVSDPLAPDCDEVIGILNAGESYYYSCHRDAVMANFTNVATVTGLTSGTGAIAVSDTDEATVDVIAPSIAIDKTSDLQTVASGSTVQFTVTVTNVGDVTLTNVTLTDDEAPLCNATVESLAPNESFNSTCSVVVTVDLLNTAVVTGTPPVGSDVSDSDAVFVDSVAALIGIDKIPDDPQWVDSGEDASFQVFITNHGDTPLTDVTISDPMAPGCDLGPIELDPHEGASASCSVGPVTDSFINIATVSATSLVGQVTGSDASRVILTDKQVCPNDMVAYWKLDETSGTTFDDFFGGHYAECDGVCPSPTAGQIAGAQAFNSDDTGLSVSSLPRSQAAFDWRADDSFSIEFWMRADQPGACSGENQVIVGRDDGPSSLHWWAGCWSTGEAAFVLIDKDGNRADQWLHGTTILAGSPDWHHVMVVRDASAEEILLYVDGAEEASSPATYDAGFDSSTAALNIGWLDLITGYHFAGTVDEVALYSRALPESEIQHHYQEGLRAERWYCETSVFAPEIFSDPVTEAAVQRPYTYDVDAIGNPTPTYTLTVSPVGLAIDPDTGLISWKPVVTQQGSHPVEVEASNSEGTDTQNFTIEVAEGPLCPAGMISYWKLDETSGITFADFYDGNDAQCGVGQCPIPTSAGRVDGGQVLDGSDEINVPADDSFDWGLNDSFSIEFWMQRPDDPTGNEVVVGRQGPAGQYPHIWTGVGEWVGNVAAFCLYDTGGTGGCVTGGTVVSGGDWHHVVAVRDADSDQLHIYVDGELDGSSGEPSYTAGFGTTTTLNIGWLNLNEGYHFSGTVDEIALYGEALDLTDIQRHYDRGLAGRGYCINPEIAIAKAADPPTVYDEEWVTYAYTVTNPGDDPLSSVGLSDDQCSPVAFVGGDDNLDDELGLDETWTYTCSMTLDQDITNVATAEGTYSLGSVVSDTTTAFVNVIHPAIALDKQADPLVIYMGETVTYTFTLTNPGDDPLSNVNLSDDQCSPVFVDGDDDLDLELGLDETWTYTCSMELDEDATNVANVTAADSLGGIVSDTATAFVDVIHPAIALDKQANSTTIYVGEWVTYTYAVTNAGDDPLSNLSPSDDLCSPVTYVGGDDDLGDDLDTDETWTYTCSMVLFEDTTNTANITATDSLGGVVSDTATTLVNVINPDIDLDKLADPAMIYPGETVTYTYTVINTQDDPLLNVGVSDDQCSPVSFAGGDSDLDDELDPGETWVYTCSMVLYTDITNIAIVTGTNSLSDVVSDTATAFVDVINPDIALDKQASPTTIYAGDWVTYTYTVINPGDDPLSNVVVSDDRCNPVVLFEGDDNQNGELDPDETWTHICSMALFTHTTNTAVVVGLDSLDNSVSDEDTASVFVSEAWYDLYLPIVLNTSSSR